MNQPLPGPGANPPPVGQGSKPPSGSRANPPASTEVSQGNQPPVGTKHPPAAKRSPKGKGPAGVKPPPGPPPLLPSQPGSGFQGTTPANRTDLPDPGEPDNTHRNLPANVTTSTFRQINVTPFWDPQPEDYIYEFAATMGNREMEWKAEKLSAGGFGTVCRWVLTDDITGELVDDITGKDVDGMKAWSHKSWWNDDLRQVPLEIAAHRTLWVPQPSETASTPISHRYILPYLGSYVNRPAKCLRIYAERAACGDLHDLARSFNPWVTEYRYSDKTDKLRLVQMGSSADYQHIPVEFLYDLFECLLEACIYMHKKGIVHRDLKPHNILLDVETDTTSRMYKWGIYPWICDFGGSAPENPIRYTNPEGFYGCLTRLFAAPEQIYNDPPYIPLNSSNPSRARPLDDKTTLFELGMTMCMLIRTTFLQPRNGGRNDGPFMSAFSDTEELPAVLNGMDADRVKKWMWPGEFDGKCATSFERMLHSLYWQQCPKLMMIITTCCRFHPDDRHNSLTELLTDVQQARKDELQPLEGGHRKYVEHMIYEVPVRFDMNMVFQGHAEDSADDADEPMADVEDDKPKGDSGDDVEMPDVPGAEEGEASAGLKVGRRLLDPRMKKRARLAKPSGQDPAPPAKRPWRPRSKEDEEDEERPNIKRQRV